MKKEFKYEPEMAKLFFNFFVIEKALANIFDSVYAEHQITTKQWLVLAIASNMERPSISQIAKILSTSHQNVKVIARNLEKNGFLKLETSSSDKRTTLVLTTHKVEELSKVRGDRDSNNMALLFGEFAPNELETLLSYLERFISQIENIKGHLE